MGLGLHMTMFKISALILFYFFTRVALSATCMDYTSSEGTSKLCWNEEYSGWFSENCLKDCDAVKFLKTKHDKKKAPASVGGQNPSAMACHVLKLPVIILRDYRENEQSFCQFPDKSLASSNAIEKGTF